MRFDSMAREIPLLGGGSSPSSTAEVSILLDDDMGAGIFEDCLGLSASFLSVLSERA